MSADRSCAECGTVVLPGDGGIRAWGRLYCSDECADCQGDIYPYSDGEAYDDAPLDWRD